MSGNRKTYMKINWKWIAIITIIVLLAVMLLTTFVNNAILRTLSLYIYIVAGFVFFIYLFNGNSQQPISQENQSGEDISQKSQSGEKCFKGAPERELEVSDEDEKTKKTYKKDTPQLENWIKVIGIIVSIAGVVINGVQTYYNIVEKNNEEERKEQRFKWEQEEYCNKMKEFQWKIEDRKKKQTEETREVVN
ncbi:hypothetical protein FACS189423_10570 [Bacteroidia bacterium]|nr:hypothetical protein FACS189423_10570 [Bacteroidia bacterium]